MGTRVSGQETMDFFINDLVASFRLSSPTIIYDNDDEIPNSCYDSQWVLCLSSNLHIDKGDPEEIQGNKESYSQNTMVQIQ